MVSAGSNSFLMLVASGIIQGAMLLSPAMPEEVIDLPASSVELLDQLLVKTAGPVACEETIG